MGRRRQFWLLLMRPGPKAVRLRDLLGLAWFCGFKRHDGGSDLLLTHPALPYPLMLGAVSDAAVVRPHEVERFVEAVDRLLADGFIRQFP